MSQILNPIKKNPWSESASELYRPSDRRLSAKWLPTFADRGCNVVSATDPYGCILGFLERSRYFFYQVAPQLYSRGSVDSVPDPLLFFSGSAWNRTRSFSYSRYSDWLRAGVRVPVGSRILTSPYRPGRLWSPTRLLSNGYREQSCRGMKLTTHLQLVLR
jgi:hypothetical protein